MTMVTKRYEAKRAGEVEMPAGEFKAKCLKVMDDVAKYRRTITITKHGKPVAKLVPLDLDQNDDVDPVAGSLASMVKVVGDIETPPIPWTDWEAYGAAPTKRKAK